MSDLFDLLLHAAVEALPNDPDMVEDKETIVGWKVVDAREDHAADPAVPPEYWLPEFGPSEIVAAKVTAAVLQVLAADPRAGLPPESRQQFENLALELEHRQLLMQEAGDV
jgi:hypothetical protein